MDRGYASMKGRGLQAEGGGGGEDLEIRRAFRLAVVLRVGTPPEYVYPIRRSYRMKSPEESVPEKAFSHGGRAHPAVIPEKSSLYRGTFWC
jgi:hypothetical protein